MIWPAMEYPGVAILWMMHVETLATFARDVMYGLVCESSQDTFGWMDGETRTLDLTSFMVWIERS